MSSEDMREDEELVFGRVKFEVCITCPEIAGK